MVVEYKIGDIGLWYYKNKFIVEHFIFKITKIESTISCDILYKFDDHNSILNKIMNGSHNGFNKYAKKLSEKEIKQWKAKLL